MIVICTKCQAKFRVADEKIGPRGAKVRCSRCQTVFLVHPELGTMPVTDGDPRPVPARTAGAVAPERSGRSEAPLAAPPPHSDPFGADPFAAPASSDPFAAPTADPFAQPAAPPAPDPFGGVDPFAAAPSAASASASPPLGDPFVAAVSPRTTLPVTDLSDLLGVAVSAPAAAPQMVAPPPLPAAAAARTERPAARAPAVAPPPAAQTVAAPSLEDPFGGDPFQPAAGGELALDVPPPAEVAPDPFAGAAAAEPDLALDAPPAAPEDGGLALEERATPTPARIPPPLPEPQLDASLETADAPAPALDHSSAGLAAAHAGDAPEPFDPGAFDFGGDPGEPLAGLDPGAPALAGPPAPATAPATPIPAPVADGAPARPPAQAAPAAPTAAPDTPAIPDRIPGGRPSRLRAAAVNAVALFALLVVALALWAVWRADGPLEAASLRPSTILAALGGRGAASPFAAQEIRSGVYDRARGAPLLFVRGRVVSRAPAAVPAVKVAVQVVRGGEVLARGEALAGAVPSAEELFLAGDDAAISAATAAAQGRAPVEVRPGDAVPFLVPLGDAPAELGGATLRIEVAPAGGSPR